MRVKLRPQRHPCRQSAVRYSWPPTRPWQRLGERGLRLAARTVRFSGHPASLYKYSARPAQANARICRRPGDYVNVPHLAEVERAALRVPKQGRAWLTLVRMPEVGTGAAGALIGCAAGGADLPRPWPHGLAGRGRQRGDVVAGPVLEDGGHDR
jgi:hypothetical protein